MNNEFDSKDMITSEDGNKKRKLTKKKKIIIGVITTIIIVLASLTTYYFLKPNPTTPDKSPKKEQKPKNEIIVKKLTIVDEDSNARPIAVMIDNNIGNGLHAGLQESYINYEVIVEGGLTRIMAVFKDKNVQLIGPVRSSRHYFLDYALESECIYAHYGWSTYAENDIKHLGVNNINGLYASAPYWRDTTIAAPHNVFTTTDKLYDYAKTQNYATETNNWKLLNYSTDEINLLPEPDKKEKKQKENSETETTQTETPTNPELLIANNINIQYSYHQNRSYTYDSVSKKYLRSMNGKAHMDKATLQQLNYKNLIIIKVPNKTLDSYGRQDLDTVGQGQGYYITNGYALPINWTKNSRSDKTKYTYSDGTEIQVNDGNTFIQIVPVTSEVTIG